MNKINSKEVIQENSTGSIRKATLEDAFTIAKINYDGRRHNCKGIIDEEVLNHKNLEKMSENMQKILQKGESVIYVKEIEGKVVGYIMSGTPRDEHSPYSAEIYSIYVDPSMQRKGIGEALMNKIADTDFNDKTSFYLRTLEQNPKSRAFYEKLGGKLFGTKEQIIGGKPYTMVGYCRQK